MPLKKPKTLFLGNLALALVLAAAVLKWTTWSGPPVRSSQAQTQVSPPPSQQTDPAANPKTLEPVDYQSLISHPLFAGNSDAGSEPKSDGVVESGPDDSDTLNLQLLGTIAGSPAVARAIIKDADTGAISHYRINDVIRGARVESIQRQEVALVRQRKRYRLVIRESSPTPSTVASADTVVEPDRSAIRDVSQRANMTPLETILATAQIEPYAPAGISEGLQITHIDELPLAGFVGLQEGDVIQYINGQFVPHKQKGFQVMQKARTQPTIIIDLLRDGENKQLVFER